MHNKNAHEILKRGKLDNSKIPFNSSRIHIVYQKYHSLLLWGMERRYLNLAHVNLLLLELKLFKTVIE